MKEILCGSASKSRNLLSCLQLLRSQPVGSVREGGFTRSSWDHVKAFRGRRWWRRRGRRYHRPVSTADAYHHGIEGCRSADAPLKATFRNRPLAIRGGVCRTDVLGVRAIRTLPHPTYSIHEYLRHIRGWFAARVHPRTRLMPRLRKPVSVVRIFWEYEPG